MRPRRAYARGRTFVNRANAALAITFVLALAATTFAALCARAAAPTRITAFGDSLTAGLGLASSESFPVRLAARLEADGYTVKIENAGVSGDTSSGGLARLNWVLGDRPQVVLVELGANDMLRGLDPKLTRANLDQTLARLLAAHVKVLLVGMLAPPNFGADYQRDFNGIYPELAKKYRVLLYPFFLDGVALDPKLNQPDGLHPNAAGVAVIVARITPYVERLLGDPAE